MIGVSKLSHFFLVITIRCSFWKVSATRQSKGRLYHPPFFIKNILFFSQPDWYVEPVQKCTLPLVKNGKIGNTSCSIGNLNILGYMHIISIRTTFVPS